jgi:hypothetical protein
MPNVKWERPVMLLVLNAPRRFNGATVAVYIGFRAFYLHVNERAVAYFAFGR